MDESALNTKLGGEAMTDEQIIELYFSRSENAITETQRKYDRYCFTIASGILSDTEDAAECVNDTWLAAWNTIPPHRPEHLAAYLGKLTRNTALKRRRDRSAAKRGGGQLDLALDELAECISSHGGTEDAVLAGELSDALDQFLGGLSKTARQVFLLRYWFLEPVEAIALKMGFSLSKTAAILRRTRLKLHDYLSKEGLI